MATLDSDVPMTLVGDGSSAAGPSSSFAKKTKRFEIKKWNAVALWAWDIVVDTAPSAGIISWIFALNVKPTKLVPQARSPQLLGEMILNH